MLHTNYTNLYTYEMRKNALKNAKTYDWAKKLVAEVTSLADMYMGQVDAYMENFPAEGVPRSISISSVQATDDVRNFCPYCGANISKMTNRGIWKIDPAKEPWKASCPGCQCKFPSNDFALLFKRGLNEQGEYDRDLAIKRNAEAVAQGEKDALVNELYPDKDANWMVDDGFGWSPKDGTYGTKDLSKYAPVAFYHHAVWYTNQKGETTSLSKVLATLSEAYLYTGDTTYGYAALRLLKKVADVYPSYHFPKVSIGYSASHGGGYNGKVIGSIWEHFVAERFIKAYAALCPLMDDAAREYIKENIVRESFRAVKAGSILGNFGMQQKVAAYVAVALDSEEEETEIFEWLSKMSKKDYPLYTDPIYGTEVELRQNNTGGELATKYVNDVDRDGFGYEVGITYNKIWLQSSVEIAEILKCCKSNKLNLYQNPKFIKMFHSFIKETIASGTSLAIGDSGSPVCTLYPIAYEMLRGYYVLRDPRLAQYYYFYVGGDLSNTYLDMFTDTSELVANIKKDIETYGELHLESENLTGFGLAVLREGEHNNHPKKQYDTWMYYGRSDEAHAHRDMLQFGIDAYGANMGPDLGYPEATAFTPNRYEWVKATISHNTVVVNGESQNPCYSGRPLHFDSTDHVKLMDIECKEAYDETDIYRRSVVTIAANDEIGYTLDFFRIKGGDSHMYSFHTQSYKGFSSDDVTWTPQVDENGVYVGTYAGADVPYGHDPYSTDTVRAEKTKYTRGYTWLTEVNKGQAPSGTFSVDFALSDFRNQLVNPKGLHLKFTALNDWIPDQVDIVKGHSQRKVINSMIPGFDYMFIHRKGENLDTLYTSLLQPYRNETYIASAEAVSCIVKAGVEGADDVAKAVKVVLKNGRTDYVVYATNNAMTYTVSDGAVAFDFNGFIGVYSVDANGNNVYSYVNDGTKIGDMLSVGAYTGTVVDFTKELVVDNQITVLVDQPVEDVSVFANQYIYMEGKSKRNAVYRILGAKKDGAHIVLDLGNCSVIDRYKDAENLDAGYLYTIEEGQPFRIPVPMCLQK